MFQLKFFFCLVQPGAFWLGIFPSFNKQEYLLDRFLSDIFFLFLYEHFAGSRTGSAAPARGHHVRGRHVQLRRHPARNIVVSLVGSHHFQYYCRQIYPLLLGSVLGCSGDPFYDDQEVLKASKGVPGSLRGD